MTDLIQSLRGFLWETAGKHGGEFGLGKILKTMFCSPFGKLMEVDRSVHILEIFVVEVRVTAFFYVSELFLQQ